MQRMTMNIRHIILAAISLAATAVTSATPSVSDADALARDGKYAEAVDAYEAILADGQESAGLYYNPGYSYFKQGMLGKSILNFERCKRLDPSDADVDANLELAYAQTDKMQVVEPLLVSRLWTQFCNWLSSDGWAVAFLILFFAAMVGVGCFLFLDSVSARKAGFFGAAVVLLLAVGALTISIRKKAEMVSGKDAIIMVSSSTLATSPDKNAMQMAVLHEGTKVTIVDTLGEWVEVKLRDGNVGWLKVADVEKI